MNLNYTYTDKSKRIAFVLMGIGIITIIAGFLFDHPADAGEHYHHNRMWANLLLNSFLFMGIGLLATFFLAVQYAAESAWATAIKRVYEAVSEYLPYGLGLMFLMLILGQFHIHHLYEWMNPAVIDLNSPEYDHIIAGKSGYFTPWFFWLRTLGYIIVWGMFQRSFRKSSIEEDLNPGVSIHWKNVRNAAIFLVFFGFTSSTMSWDWIMSLDIHWFSTMFGWYTFSGMWISSLIMIMLFTLYLKKRGYLEFVNDSHIHDLGKWIFAVSFLWSYLFFMQFMLIWYTNIPEEVTYYIDRIHSFGYRGVWWGMFVVNFAIPMVVLMARDSKRHSGILATVCVIIFIGHYLDLFTMIMPASVRGNWHLSWMEVGTLCGFLGLFLHVVHRALAKVPLLAKNHPFAQESLNLHT